MVKYKKLPLFLLPIFYIIPAFSITSCSSIEKRLFTLDDVKIWEDSTTNITPFFCSKGGTTSQIGNSYETAYSLKNSSYELNTNTWDFDEYNSSNPNSGSEAVQFFNSHFLYIRFAFSQSQYTIMPKDLSEWLNINDVNKMFSKFSPASLNLVFCWYKGKVANGEFNCNSWYNHDNLFGISNTSFNGNEWDVTFYLPTNWIFSILSNGDFYNVGGEKKCIPDFKNKQKSFLLINNSDTFYFNGNPNLTLPFSMPSKQTAS